nr:uncharacterized protein LOC119165772 [Rhipicephalus microplus]
MGRRHLLGGRLVLVFFSLAHLLICAGDVELNPGPDKVDQVVALVKEFTASNERFQKEVTNKLKDIHTTVTDLKRRLSKIEERLESVDNLSESVKAVGSVVQESQEQLKTIEQKQTHQANLVVDDLNNRMRRNNLVFKGVPEQAAEKWSDTEKLIHEFVTENLGIQPGEIERAHRVGQRKPDRTRPVVVKFLNFKDKSNILKNAFKLKDLATPRVWIEEDFSPRVQLIRKTLRDFARAKRQKNEKYKLQFDKLIMGNVIFTVDSSSNKVVPIPRQDAPAIYE